MKKAQIFPSLMAADVLNLEFVIKRLEPHCDGFHIDIMDNHFVPNLTWGPGLTNAIARIAQKPLLVHLMVEKPEYMIDQLALTPRSVISFHIEATENVHDTIALIKTAGYTPSIAIKPSTSLEKIIPLLKNDLPHVLLMSVEPGFSGQKFLPNSVERLKQLVTIRKETKKLFIICMDGGINTENIGPLYQEGAQQFAVGSTVFDKHDMVAMEDALQKLYQATNQKA